MGPNAYELRITGKMPVLRGLCHWPKRQMSPARPPRACLLRRILGRRLAGALSLGYTRIGKEPGL